MSDRCICNHLCRCSKLLKVSFSFVYLLLMYLFYWPSCSSKAEWIQCDTRSRPALFIDPIFFFKRWQGDFLEASLFPEANLSQFIGQAILSISLHHELSFPCAALSDGTLGFFFFFFFPMLTHGFWPNSCFAKWLRVRGEHFLHLIYILDVHRQTCKRPLWWCSCRNCIAFSYFHPLSISPSPPRSTKYKIIHKLLHLFFGHVFALVSWVQWQPVAH